jgi:signal peptidase II
VATPRLRFLAWLGVALGVVIADQISKAAILSAFVAGESLKLTSFFNLVLVANTGAAFSFLAGAAGWQRWFFVALALVISAWIGVLLHRHASERLMPTALALILGGALGNVVDRLTLGAVVDFLDFHLATWHFPAFNVADSAITVGVALMLWCELFGGKQR